MRSAHFGFVVLSCALLVTMSMGRAVEACRSRDDARLLAVAAEDLKRLTTEALVRTSGTPPPHEEGENGLFASGYCREQVESALREQDSALQLARTTESRVRALERDLVVAHEIGEGLRSEVETLHAAKTTLEADKVTLEADKTNANAEVARLSNRVAELELGVRKLAALEVRQWAATSEQRSMVLRSLTAAKPMWEWHEARSLLGHYEEVVSCRALLQEATAQGLVPGCEAQCGAAGWVKP